MKKFLLIFGTLLLAQIFDAHAQLDFTKWVNPGPLSSPHKTLEGIKNCTQCHSTAQGVPDEKCLNCHKEIDERIKQRKGFHSRVMGSCVKCHGEHKGADYDVTGLSRMVFDHTETGWPLTGKHANMDCPKCHTKTRKNVMTGELGQRRTYLGNTSTCQACHKSPHQNRKQAFQQCYKCHDTSSWAKREQPNFSHNQETKFALTGSHEAVDCIKCHTKKVWAPLSMACSNCHKDPHGGRFGTTCETCHNTKAWASTSATASKPAAPVAKPGVAVKAPGKTRDIGKAAPVTAAFDHSKTAFPLLGKHQTVPCKSCHGSKLGKIKKNFSDCVGCHADVHKGAFAPTPCYSCHNNDGFKNVKMTPAPTPAVQSSRAPVSSASTPAPVVSAPRTTAAMAGFDHTTTGFPLVGKHQAVTCDNCHEGGKFKGVGRSCNSCHNDFHKGELGFECERCHSPLQSFNDIEFNHNREARFRLDGAHVRNQCNQCHWNNKYKFGDFSCSTCHFDVHKGANGQKCENCHTTTGFKQAKVGFHEFGSFRITGVHDKMDCVTCHNPKAPARARPMECSSCHKDPHMGSLSQECSNCHGQVAWLPTTFRHNQTGFELSGAHRFLSCDSCHKNRIFGGLPTECMFCHLKDFNAGLPAHVGGSMNCSTCHYTFGFRPAKQ
ncbi:MAG: hypothetical protein IT286_05030 [Proteobacteria bacterium]|nr:hypothetical protein [Pseudomonadota bacterium]